METFDLNKYQGLEVIVITKLNDKYVGIITKDSDGFFKLWVDENTEYYINKEIIKSIELSK